VAGQARSPDLTLLDFFLWGNLKSTVYAKKPRDMNELKEMIRDGIVAITVPMLENVMDQMSSRLQRCIGGKQVEV
jgi:hypothetical protein